MARVEDSSTRPESIRDFEDFRCGTRITGGGRLVVAADLAPAFAQTLFAPTVFLEWFAGAGLARDSTLGLVESHWVHSAPIREGDRLRFDMTITRCRRAPAGDRGTVRIHVRALNQDDCVAFEGTAAVLVRARARARPSDGELFDRAWAGKLAERLNATEAFRSATATWDGTIGLGIGEDEVHFRIYRGKVLEAGVRSLDGPTFTLVASDLVWTQIVTGSTDDFMRRLMQAAFSVRGAAYEYLRLTKALCILVECARAQFREGLPP